MRSVMSHNFSQIPRADIPRSTFDRSHGYKTTLDAGYLVPFYVDEVLPGDTFRLNASLFARLATPQKPVMDNMFMETFYFAVPKRLVWENWQKFCGEKENPDDDTEYEIPQIESLTPGGWSIGEVGDYFGIPTGIEGLFTNALPFRCYNLIVNEWFRDQNLQDSMIVDKGDGPDSPTTYPLVKRCKKHDYFTSCLPWPQKGPDVMLPLGSTAPVYGNGTALGLTNGTVNFGLMDATPYAGGYNNVFFHRDANGEPVGSALTGFGTENSHNKVVGVMQSGETGIFADLEAATAATINNLREAFQIQRLYERDARGGTRYAELLRSHFGVTSPDSRLQRPEYLGGSSTRININPVQQTNRTTYEEGGDVDGTPQGNLAAFGLASDTRGGFTKSFVEHCYIIGLVNVRSDLTYQQGLNRMWSRLDRFDFYWPALAHLGEQEVLNKEIYCQGPAELDPITSEVVDDMVFGYQERFAEYRYKPSLITGKFRSSDPQSLDVWHLSEDFGSLPVLSDEFIQDSTNTQISRIVAVNTEPQFLLDVYFNLKCARPMPVYSVPGLIDHF